MAGLHRWLREQRGTKYAAIANDKVFGRSGNDVRDRSAEKEFWGAKLPTGVADKADVLTVNIGHPNRPSVQDAVSGHPKTLQ